MNMLHMGNAETPPSLGPLPSIEQQRLALETINAELSRSDKGRYASLKNAEILGSKIQSSLVARRILLSARKNLRNAAGALQQYNFWDKAMGVQEANINLIVGNLNSINQAEKQLPSNPMATIPGLLAAKVGLIALQCYDNLVFTKTMTARSAAESTISSIINEFGDALAEVLQAAVDKVLVPVVEQAPKVAFSLTPLIVPAGIMFGGYFLLKHFIFSRAD